MDPILWLILAPFVAVASVAASLVVTRLCQSRRRGNPYLRLVERARTGARR